MGKRIISQRRGRGSHTYTANTHKAKADVEHSREERTGVVQEIEHDPARSAPLARVRYEDGEEEYLLAPEGLMEGDQVETAREAPLRQGNTLPVAEIPEGVPIYNIELQPGDGGKISRSSGTYCFIVSHEPGKALIHLPSGEIKEFNPDCRATVGQVAGGGRTAKDMRKAGDKHHLAKARGKLYPRTSAVAMNATDHPFGGSAKPGKPKTVSRDVPAGKKVGSIAASRTGRSKE